MPLDGSGLTVERLDVRVAQLQAALTTALTDLGLAPPDFDGTIEEALTQWAALVAFNVEDRQRVIVDALDPDHATSANLDRFGAAVNLPRRPPSTSRYIVTATIVSGSVLYPAGAILEDPVARTRWRNSADVTVVPGGTNITIDAIDAGPAILPSVGITTMRQVTPIAGITPGGITYDPGSGDPYIIGRDRESDAAYRARLRQLRSTYRGPTYSGIRAALLDVPWISAVSITRVSVGTLLIRVVPAPIGSDQTLQLATAISDSVGIGTATSGAQSLVVSLPGGETQTVRWDLGATFAVNWSVTLTLSGAILSDVQAGVESAIAELMSGFNAGDSLYLLSAYRAIAEVDSRITGAVVLLNGSAANITPANSTILLVLGTVIVA